MFRLPPSAVEISLAVGALNKLALRDPAPVLMFLSFSSGSGKVIFSEGLGGAKLFLYLCQTFLLTGFAYSALASS